MRLPIGQRIGIGLAILLALQIILFITILFDVGEYRRNALLLNTYIVPSSNILSDIEQQHFENLADSLHYVITGVPSHLDERADGVRAMQEMLTTLTSLQQQAPHDVVGHQVAVASLQQHIQQSDQAIELIIDQRANGDQIDAVAFSAEIDRQEDLLRAAIVPLATLLSQDEQSALLKTQADPLRTPAAISLSSFLLAIGMILFIIRPIVQRLKRLQLAAAQLTTSSQVKQLAVEGNDEIADLARTLNVMLQQIDDQQRVLQERTQHLEQANYTQEQLLTTIQSLAVPVIPVGPQTLALPLMGVLDAKRMQQITQELLDAVYRSRVHMVLIDVTGLAIADRSVAHFLLDMATSLKLLGSQVAITGMNASLAQTLVEQEANTQQLQVYATLREGIAASLR